jgi:chemotaxis protein CheC
MDEQTTLWNRLISGPRSDYTLRMAMWRVARALSTISGRTISNGDPRIEHVPITQITTYASGPEEEMVGIYLVMSGGLHGQALLILPITSALYLADSLLGEPPGTATELGAVERSALAEIGNLTVSAFLTTMAAQNPQSPRLLRPSPPAVMVDMLDVILNAIVTPVATVRDDLLIIEMDFGDVPKAIHGRFWVIPDPTLKDLAARDAERD